MHERESILPLILGLIVALGTHLGIASAYATLRLDTPVDLIEPDARERLPDRPPVDATPRPDLTVTDLTATAPRIVGQPTTLGVTLSNLGDGAAQNVEIELAVDGHPGATQTIDETQTPGASQPIEFEWTALTPGPHRVDITADPQNNIEESDEDNNAISRTFIWLTSAVAAGSGGPDLAAVSVATETPRRAGQPVGVTALVANLGVGVQAPVRVTLSLDGQPIETADLPDGLAAGGLEELAWRITVPDPGEHDLTVGVAMTQEPAAGGDVNGANDELTRRFYWGEPISVGQEKPSPVRMNWIAYEDFQDLIARKSRVTQAAAQKTVDPTPEVQNTPTDPTPPGVPAPRTVVSLTSIPPQDPSKPTPPAPPTPPAQPDQATPRVVSAVTRLQPEVAEAPEKPRSTEAPFITELNSPVPVAAAPTERAPQAASRIEAVNPDNAEQARPLTDATRPPVDSPVVSKAPVETVTRREYAVRLPDVPDNPAAVDQIPVLPKPSSDAPTSENRAVRHAPLEAVAVDSNPDDRSRAVAVLDDLPKPQTAALPLEAKPDDQPGSPQLVQPLDRPKDRTSTRALTPESLEDPEKPEEKTEPLNPTPPGPPTPVTPPAPRPMVASLPKPTVAPKVEREAPPVTRIDNVMVVPGKVVAKQGVVVNTVVPRFSIVARMTSVPRNPKIEIVFDKTGHVIKTKVLTSTGHDTFDGPLLTAIYKWTVKPESLHRIHDTLTMTVHVLLNNRDSR
ncbi:MAG: CARDB domain-containing protein [Planctomycetota bacterium]|jgi:hypothetical protein